jgi:hypothetical protein
VVGWDQLETLTAAVLNPEELGLIVDLAELCRQLWSATELVRAAIREAEIGLIREAGEG